jgi:flagellar basal body-associated protein FliL
MADEDDKKNQDDAGEEKTAEEKNETKQEGKTGIGIVTWIILAVIVVICAGSGLLLGRLFAGSNEPQTQPAKADELTPVETDDSGKDSGSSWYYDLEPVVANLDEPGVTRYVRATITLEISSSLEQNKGVKLIEEKKPVLTNWLTIYLASLTLEDTRGDRNLKRIQLQILDAFNETLFPDAKPLIKHVLFKEFAIQ